MSRYLTIIDRYIIKEILQTWAAVLLVLMVVVTSVEVVQFMNWFLSGELTTSTVLPLFINGQLKFIILLLPISLFLGVLLTFSRLYMDSEMTAMMAGGIGPRQWMRSLLLLAVPVSVAVLFMMMYMRPWIAVQRAEINEAIRDASITSTLSAGRFNRAQDGEAVFYAESISDDGKHMLNVFQRYQRDGKTHVDIADMAIDVVQDNGLNYMLLKNGKHYAGVPGKADYSMMHYSEYGILIPEPEDRYLPPRVKTISTRDLLDSDRPEHRAELDWRISMPVATLIISMIALPLSQTTPRGGRYSKLALAILIYLVYTNLLGIGFTWISKQVVPYWIGTSWVHVLGLIVLFILLKRSGMLPVKRARKAAQP